MLLLNRRSVLFLGCSTLFGCSALGRPLVNSPVQSASDAASPSVPAMDFWMKQAMTDRSPVNSLNFSRFADPMYFLLKPIGWKPDQGQQPFVSVTVPSGFVTDLASIPRLFWSALRPDGDYAYAAIIHDYLYWTQDRPKDEADLILKLAMEDFDVSPAKVLAIYQAVRLLGDSAWQSNAKLKREGEKRILRRFPSDPTVRWDIWKLQDVF